MTTYCGVLEPGDILYIPALWFHNILTLEEEGWALSINIFWKNLPQEIYDKKDIYGNKDLLPAQLVRKKLLLSLNIILVKDAQCHNSFLTLDVFLTQTISILCLLQNLRG